MTKELTKEDYVKNTEILYKKMLRLAKQHEKHNTKIITTEIGVRMESKK